MAWWNPGDWDVDWGDVGLGVATGGSSLVGGGLGSAAMPLVGTALSMGSDLYGGYMSNEFAADQSLAAANLQREFAQMGIQWRVQDAMKAGIHPLAALGASTHSGQPTIVGDSMGPAIARAGQTLADRITQKYERQIHERMQVAQLENAKREGMILDRQARNLDQDYIERIEGQRDSAMEPHIQGGRAESWYQRYKIGPGFEILAPKSEGEHPLETIESMSPLHREAWIRYNAAVYGPGWESQFRNWYHFGVPPGEHKKGDRR